ncbi:MAG: 1-deoxy-D-xylulose-5-phosphate reductoisomerase, partial [Candidatus Hydrogenedentes bacterium]|nr:1-deoxy-D-xylulose-5-phosphate reductoisomerase [Candidatus Hydrogenedentota bacterium]
MTRKRISILGSTGSIGRNTLEVVRRNPDRFSVVVLASRSNTGLLRKQIAEFKPEQVAVYDESAAAELRASGVDCAVLAGASGLVDAAAVNVDVTLCAIVGAVGLQPLLAAIDAGNRVAVANKEPLVMAGEYIMAQAQRNGVDVLPVDSEHNAIFQCLQGNAPSDIDCVYLTASGGPFYGWAQQELQSITPEQAMRHPTWDMGTKISVDSATLMNKGLEIIEALCLFRLRSEQVKVIIHPQSVIHSMVAFLDGSIIAQLGVTDMKAPIAFALTYPERIPAPEMRLDLMALTGLTFGEPDYSAFRCLALAREAANQGGSAPATLNGANEEAVAAFCSGRIGFLDIATIVERTMETCPVLQESSL